MNLEEYLRKKAEEEISSVLTEEEKEYCRKLVLESEAERHAVIYSRKFWVCFSCALCVLLAAVITLLVVFVPRKSPMRYFDENIEFRSSTVEELNSDAKYFYLNTVEDSAYNFNLYYDNDTSDKLYYNVNIKGFAESSKIDYVINKNYSYKYDKTGELLKEQLNGYVLNYYPATSSGIDGVEYSGWIRKKTETVYITYTQLTPLGDQAFFTFVESVISVK